MDINQGYVHMTINEFAEIIAAHEKRAMKNAISALITDFNNSVNKIIIDLLYYHYDSVDISNTERGSIIAKEIIENQLNYKLNVIN